MSAPPTVSALPEKFVREALKLEHQLCFALYSASGAMTRAYRDLLAPIGLTYPQYITMMALWETAPRTVSSIASSVCMESGTITPLLKRLEAQGLVTRRRDDGDERRVLVDLTPKGDQLRYEAARVPIGIVGKLGGSRTELVELLSRVKAFTRDLAAPADEAASDK